MCAPVAFEIGYSAQSHAAYLSVSEHLLSFSQVPINDADHQRALQLQCLLSEKGQHRALSLVDALVAAVAEARQLIVLHYDRDYETIAQSTGQLQQWIVPAGSAD
jgi:predicted nucleic acid-binding protein